MLCMQNETLLVVWAICHCWLVVIPSSELWCQNAGSKAMHSAVFFPFVGNFKIFFMFGMLLAVNSNYFPKFH